MSEDYTENVASDCSGSWIVKADSKQYPEGQDSCDAGTLNSRSLWMSNIKERADTLIKEVLENLRN